MKWVFDIGVRLLFIATWFLLGFVQTMDIFSGFVSAVLAFVLMEVCYTIDRKTNGIDKIMQRLDFLDETLNEAAKTRDDIIDAIDIIEDNISDNQEHSLGEKDGLEEAKQVVNKRFNQVAEELKDKKSYEHAVKEN